MKYIKDFIVQVNSREESEKLGYFLRNNNITTGDFTMNSSNKAAAYVIENNKVIRCPCNWGELKFNYRLFQNLDELKNYFRNQEILSNNYEIY